MNNYFVFFINTVSALNVKKCKKIDRIGLTLYLINLTIYQLQY